VKHNIFFSRFTLYVSPLYGVAVGVGVAASVGIVLDCVVAVTAGSGVWVVSGVAIPIKASKKVFKSARRGSGVPGHLAS
jgi:hypothetical protein